MRDWRSQSHVRWYCRYHVVFAPKYRKKSIFGRLRRDIGGARINMGFPSDIFTLQGAQDLFLMAQGDRQMRIVGQEACAALRNRRRYRPAHRHRHIYIVLAVPKMDRRMPDVFEPKPPVAYVQPGVLGRAAGALTECFEDFAHVDGQRGGVRGRLPVGWR